MDDLRIERSRDEAKGGEVVHLSGRVTIAHALELKQALLDALHLGTGVRVDLGGVVEIDLSGLQIMCAAHQSAQTLGTLFQVCDAGNPLYREVVEGAGFQRHVGCARDNSTSCIWVGGEC